MSGGPKGPKVTAEQRLDRILAMIPWIVAHDGPTVQAVCERFGCTPAGLASDIELLYLCGLHPYTPDLLIEAGIVDDRVFVQYAEYLSRPLRLTPAEGLALVASATTLLSTPGTDPEGPLARGLAKLAAAIGVGEVDVDVDLGTANTDLLAELQAAVASPTQLQLTYYAYGRDQTTHRAIEPGAVFSSGGAWYLAAFCHLANAERLFRVDRILAVAPLAAERTVPPVTLGPSELNPGAGGDAITLVLDPAASWVREQYPIESVSEEADGRLVVTMLVSEWPWLDRLLLRLGPLAEVRTASSKWPGRAEAASRVLARYERY